jgi:sugar phosphate isomerase/epimerase
MNQMVLKGIHATMLALLVSFLFSCSQEQEQTKDIGLQLWSVREDMNNDPKATLEKLGQMNYRFVEAAGYRDGKFYGMEPAEFKALVEANNLRFLSSHTGQDVPDSANWDNTMAWWDTCIQAHKDAGVQYIVQPWMGKVGYSSLEGLQRYVEYFNAVGEKCRDAGIVFGYHNHADEFKELEGVVIYDYMLENTDPDKVMFQMDVYWVNEGGADPVDYFNRYPGRFTLLHIKDKAELGENGVMNFQPIFENAEKAGMEHYIVEVEQYNYEPIESVRRSAEYLMAADYVKR